jgi:hypothetical protein
MSCGASQLCSVHPNRSTNQRLGFVRFCVIFFAREFQRWWAAGQSMNCVIARHRRWRSFPLPHCVDAASDLFATHTPLHSAPLFSSLLQSFGPHAAICVHGPSRREPSPRPNPPAHPKAAATTGRGGGGCVARSQRTGDATPPMFGCPCRQPHGQHVPLRGRPDARPPYRCWATRNRGWITMDSLSRLEGFTIHAGKKAKSAHRLKSKSACARTLNLHTGSALSLATLS